MTNEDQTDAFAKELDKLVLRFCVEFDLTYATIIGTLEIKKHLLLKEKLEEET